MTARRYWSFTALLVIAVLAVYWPGANGGFVFDDFPNIVENAALRVTDLAPASWSAAAFSSDAGTMQRPLAMLTFAANHYFTGLDPAAMKWTNIAIHALNALLVFGLMQALLSLAAPGYEKSSRQCLAALIAAAWALHPINQLGVLYVVQRMESLAHLFVFGGLWLYVAGRQRQLEGGNGGWQVGLGLVGGTFLGLLCKESAALLPLYAWLLEICLPTLRAATDRRRMQLLFGAVLWLPAIAGLAWLMPRVLAPGAFATRDFSLVERLMTEPRVVLDYLHWTLLPSLGELSLYHDDYVVSRSWLSPPATLFSAIALAGLAAFAWWLRGRRPLVALGLLWFLAAQSMTATVIPLELVFEHRNYFASLGVCLAVGDLVRATVRTQTRRLPLVLGVGLVTVLGALTWLRASEWRDPYRFASTEAAKHPTSPRASYALGQTLVVMTGYRADSTFLGPAKRSLEHARTLPDSGILPHSALLLLAAHTGQPIPGDWWLEMQGRLRARPVTAQDINAVASLARCARDKGCAFPPQRMVDTFEAGLTHGPQAGLLNVYADYTFNVLHNPARAIRLWRHAIAMKPTTGQYRVNLAMVLIAMGEKEQAEQEIAALRKAWTFGRFEAAAADLEIRLGQGRRPPRHSAGPTAKEAPR
jgi:protein O-mannosyl-transferase